MQTALAKKIKSQLLAKHNRIKKIRCFYCERLHRRQTLTLEHILPKSYGGTDDFENCVLACEQCNQLRNRLVRHIEFIRDFYPIFINSGRPKHCKNKYWSAVWHASQLLVKHSERLKIDFNDCMSLLEELHGVNAMYLTQWQSILVCQIPLTDKC